ncbi:hypothetical protein B0H19DRAFT_1060857 [Mycena capillaripes]|nr:hypothetical protein B0H19DRAFT_1060857 [Mycena capillaripes]
MNDTQDSISAGRHVVLILALEDHLPEFRRCNQDDLGDRRQVENLARQSLREGSSVCIDRTNFDASQRAHWIKIAREFPGTLVWVLVFDTPKDVCASRLRTRTQHPTIKNPEDALSILDRFSSQYRAPSPDEGYDKILYLQPSEQEVLYSHSSLAAILRRVCDAPSVASTVGPAVSQHSTRGSPYSRGGSFRGVRGRGRGGHNVNHAGSDGAGNAPTRNLNKWSVFSEQQGERAKETASASAPKVSVAGESHSSEPKAADAEGLSNV